MAFVDDANLAATGSGQGANMVGFIQDGTGAVSRTALEKLRDTVSVKDFGAAGDGLAHKQRYSAVGGESACAAIGIMMACGPALIGGFASSAVWLSW